MKRILSSAAACLLSSCASLDPLLVGLSCDRVDVLLRMRSLISESSAPQASSSPLLHRLTIESASENSRGKDGLGCSGDLVLPLDESNAAAARSLAGNGIEPRSGTADPQGNPDVVQHDAARWHIAYQVKLDPATLRPQIDLPRAASISAFLGELYFATRSAPPARLTAAQNAAAKKLYMQHCAACHHQDGRGIPPTFPALPGSPTIARGRSAVADLIRTGRNLMPATPASAEEQQLLADYVLATFGSPAHGRNSR